MTHYNLKPITLASLAVLKVKAASQKLLAVVSKQRAQRAKTRHQEQQDTQKVYATVLKELLTSIQQELAAGRSVSFLGFGTFSTRMHRGGRGRNFKTGKPIEYKAVRIPVFRPGSLLKQAVRKKK